MTGSVLAGRDIAADRPEISCGNRDCRSSTWCRGNRCVAGWTRPRSCRRRDRWARTDYDAECEAGGARRGGALLGFGLWALGFGRASGTLMAAALDVPKA